mgnify:FL=1
MKITDYSVIQNEIQNQLLDQDWSIEDYLSETAIVLAVANIYTTNDLMSGFGQDFSNSVGALADEVYQNMSIISSRDRISIILDSRMSYYKSDVPICGYESLEEDIAYIFMVIQLVFDRLDSQ